MYTVSFPNSNSAPDTGKYRDLVSDPLPSMPISFTFTEHIYEQMGFDNNSTVTFVPDSSSTQSITFNVIKMQKEDSLFIHASFVNGNGNDNVLDDAESSNIVFLPRPGSKPFIAPHDNTVRASRADNDFPIDLNGQNIVFSLLLSKKQNVYS